MNKHTPTPYYIGKPADMGQPLFEISSDASAFWIAGVGAPDEVRQIAEANARFIVRACNAHDALVAALEAADALDMPYKEGREVLIRHGWDETCQPTKFVESLRRAALALAGEGQA